MRLPPIAPVLLLLAALPGLARAEDLCESTASVHKRAMYCDDNWEFLAPAAACQKEFADLVTATQKRLKAQLGSRLKEAKADSQNANFAVDAQILATSLDEVSYLIDFGKQVHTELEDYVASLTPPVYDESDRGNPADPVVKARYMDSECYSDPVNELNALELKMRPSIAEFEKTKAQLQAMSAVTGKRDSQLDALGAGPVSSKPAASGAENDKAGAGVPSGNSSHSSSTITGEIKDDSKQK